MAMNGLLSMAKTNGNEWFTLYG